MTLTLTLPKVLDFFDEVRYNSEQIEHKNNFLNNFLFERRLEMFYFLKLKGDLKRDITDIFLLVIIFFLLFLLSGCAAGGYYKTPCNPPHFVGGKAAEELKKGKDDNDVIKCPVCGENFPSALLVKRSRHICGGDEVRWYHGFGWRWTGPYGYYGYRP